MPYETSKAPAGTNGGALGNVICLAAVDTRETSQPLRDLQATFIARRFGLSAPVAAVVASLAYGEVRG